MAATVESLIAEYEQVLAGMRATFGTGKTQSLAWRRQQLEQLHLMHVENHEAMTAAVRQDLGGPKLRGVAELAGAGGADHMLDHLDEYTSEKWVAGWVHRQCVRPEPKGVMLIIAPWNFPILLCLHPLAAAIAAGNMVVIKPSEMSPTTSQLLKTLLEKYMDNDCIKVIEGAKDDSPPESPVGPHHVHRQHAGWAHRDDCGSQAPHTRDAGTRREVSSNCGRVRAVGRHVCSRRMREVVELRANLCGTRLRLGA